MTLTLDLPAEIAARLAQEANEHGASLDAWALTVLANHVTFDEEAEEQWSTHAYDRAKAEIAAGAPLVSWDDVKREHDLS